MLRKIGGAGGGEGNTVARRGQLFIFQLISKLYTELIISV